MKIELIIPLEEQILLSNFRKNKAKGIRYPRLDPVMIVEEFIKEHSGEFKIYQLWKALPKNQCIKLIKLS